MTWKPDYLTVAQAKAFIRVPDADTLDDTEIGQWITAASRAIDTRCNRQFGSVVATRVYRRPAAYDPTTGLWALEVDDFQTTAGMTVDGVAFASSGCVALPDNAVANGKAYERIAYNVQPIPPSPGYPTPVSIAANPWGWSAVPAPVLAAAKLQINRWAARRDSPYGIAGSPDQGSEMRLLAKLDPDVHVMLAGLARRRRAG